MPHGGPHARQNEFVNRRTGEPIPEGTPYHMHPDKGPMEGAEHNPDIPGGTAGHDFYDRVNGRNQMANWTTADGTVYRGRTVTVGDTTYSTRGGAIEGTSQILHMSETNDSSMAITPRRATVTSNPINRRTNRRRQTTRQANRQIRVGSNNRNPMRNNVMRNTQNRATPMRTNDPMSIRRTTRNHSGGHMHNLQDAQTNIEDYQTLHRHFTEAPSQWDPMTGEPLYDYQNATFNALFHRHFEYDNAGDESSPDAGMTGRPYWHAYGTTDTPGFNTAHLDEVAPGQPQGNLPNFPSTMNVSGQTTGEVGSVPGAGHIHQSSPNIRNQNGNGNRNGGMRQTQRRTTNRTRRARTNNTMMNNRRTNRRNGY